MRLPCRFRLTFCQKCYKIGLLETEQKISEYRFLYFFNKEPKVFRYNALRTTEWT
jgi:hypothetical protein